MELCSEVLCLLNKWKEKKVLRKEYKEALRKNKKRKKFQELLKKLGKYHLQKVETQIMD